MADVKISEMTPDSSVGGGELIAVSDSATAKSVTIDNIKDYTIDAIEAIGAKGSVSGSDSVFILQSGVLAPADIDLVAQHAIDTIWGKAAESSPADGDKLALKDDGDVEKTVLLSVLGTYMLAELESTILNISDLADGSGALAASDYLLVTQGTTGKQITVEDIEDFILANFDDYVTALNAVGTSAGTDVLYCIQSGIEKKVTLATISTYLGNPPSAPGTTTQDNIPQWSTVTGDLKDGLALTTTLGDPGTDTNLTSEQGVREALDSLINDHADIGAALAAADTILVDDGAGGTQKKSALSRVWTYIWSNFTGASAKTTPVSADIIPIQDTADSNAIKEMTITNMMKALDIDGMTDIGAAIADADLIIVDDGAGGTNRKCVASRIPTYVSTKIEAANGLAISGLDIDGASDIAAGLADADLLIVDDGAGGTNRKSAISRVWTYILAKIVALTDVSTHGWFLDEDTLTSDDDTKVPSQQSVKAYIDSGTVTMTNKTLTSPVIGTKITFDETTNDLDMTASDQSSASGSVDLPDINGIAATAQVFPTAVDGTLATGANADVTPTKLVYNKACEDGDGDDVIDLHDGTYLGQIVTIYLGTKTGADDAIITPVTAVSYTTITLDAANEIATLQWQGATVGWAILYTNGTVA